MYFTRFLFKRGDEVHDSLDGHDHENKNSKFVRVDDDCDGGQRRDISRFLPLAPFDRQRAISELFSVEIENRLFPTYIVRATPKGMPRRDRNCTGKIAKIMMFEATSAAATNFKLVRRNRLVAAHSKRPKPQLNKETAIEMPSPRE